MGRLEEEATTGPDDCLARAAVDGCWDLVGVGFFFFPVFFGCCC